MERSSGLGSFSSCPGRSPEPLVQRWGWGLLCAAVTIKFGTPSPHLSLRTLHSTQVRFCPFNPFKKKLGYQYCGALIRQSCKGHSQSSSNWPPPSFPPASCLSPPAPLPFIFFFFCYSLARKLLICFAVLIIL